MKDVLRAAVIAFAAAVLAGCGSREEERAAEAAPAGEEAAPQTEEGHDTSRKVCEMKTTVPVAREWTTYWDHERVQHSGSNDSHASSIHWADAEGEKALASNPNALSVTCASDGSPELMVSLQSIGSTKADIPQGPGTYPIVPRSTDGSVKPGTFIAPGLHFDGLMFEATGGTLTVERLDMNGVAGSFVVDGVEHPAQGTRSIHVEGSFDIPCVGDQLERLCTAPERRRQ
jgi:hypothetical protein